MKRFATAAVAAATALSLTTGVAAAQDSSVPFATDYTQDGVTSSNINDAQLQSWGNAVGAAGTNGFASSVTNESFQDFARGTGISSIKNDAAHGWKFGTTLEIIWITLLSISAVVGLGTAAAQAGLIPGVNLPK